MSELSDLINTKTVFDFCSVKEETFGIIAFISEKPIGYIHCHQYRQEVEIDYIHIDVAFRKQGIGSRLINLIEHFSISLKCNKLTLLVDQMSNKQAYKLHLKLGFELEDPSGSKDQELVYMFKTIK